ncbi:MAG TPA: hypothetical protein VK484_08495 [Ferruginibacter sp.]|nr:hypothetical protein [Ferruginibacter sp.]
MVGEDTDHGGLPWLVSSPASDKYSPGSSRVADSVRINDTI